MPTGVDPFDIYHNGFWYNRNGRGGPVSSDNVSGALNSGLVFPRQPGQALGMRLFIGRQEFDFNNTSANTWELLLALEQDCDAVQVIFSQSRNAGATTAAPVMLCRVAAVGDTANATADNADWSTPVNVSGSGTWNLTAGSAQFRRAFVVSDWVNISTIPRTDGGTKPLLAIRAWVNGGNPLTLNGQSGGGESFTNWATKPDGRIWKVRKAAGNFASANQTTFTAAPATAANEWPVVGIRYLARGRVVTVMSFGDSIDEGRGTYLGEGFWAPSAWAKSSASAVAYEYCNLAWSGSQSSVHLNAMTDAFAAGLIPDIACFPAGTPNDVAGNITAAIVSAAKGRVAQMYALCATNRVVPVVRSWLPSNTATKNYGATDPLRTAWVATVEASANRGLVVCPTATAISGVTTGGQVQMLAGSTDDGIHPNDTGNALLSQGTIIPEMGELLS